MGARETEGEKGEDKERGDALIGGPNAVDRPTAITKTFAEEKREGQATAKKRRTWLLLSSYLRTTLIATFCPVLRSLALYTFENAPLPRVI